MRTESDLHAAGRRASLRPVPAPPPLAELQHRADKMATKRRVLGSSLAALVLLAIGVPVALNARGTTTVQNVAAGTGDAAPAAQVEAPGEPEVPNGDTDEQETDDVRVQISDATTSFALQLITGSGAEQAAQAAAAAADESLDIDGMTIWIDEDGDQRTVSALVEPEAFVAITGDAAQLDALIDMLRSGEGMSSFSFGGPGPHSFDFEGFGENFNGFPDGFDFEGFGEDFNLDDFNFEGFGENFNLDDFNFEGFGENFNGFPDGFDFEGFGEDFNLDDFNFNFGFDNEHFSGFGDFGDAESLEDLIDKLEEHRGELEQFFATNEFGLPFGADTDGCFSIDGDSNGETFSFAFPEGCRSDG